MACASNLLANEKITSPPKLQRSYSTKKRVERQIQETIDILPLHDGDSTPSLSPPAPLPSQHPIHDWFLKGPLIYFPMEKGFRH